jgi:hypothetical protein
MLKRLSPAVALALVLGPATAVTQDVPPGGVDVSGNWAMTWEGPQGTARMQLELAATDSTLTGRIETRRGWQDITDGEITSDGVTFAVQMRRGERSFLMRFTGTIADPNTLQGTFVTPRGDTRAWSATRGP